MKHRESRARGDVIVSGLRELGVDCSIPGGAIYVVSDVFHLRERGQLTYRLLK